MNEKIAYLFPGQGAQFVGMGKNLAAAHSSAKEIYERADSLLGFSIRQICFEGPEDELTRTAYAQPAIFVTSLAAHAVLRERFGDLNPALTAGLSLGEFSALVAANALSFEEGLLLVQKRAQAMEEASQKNPGAMASIIGLSLDACEAIARETHCEVANINSSDQIVLSGSQSAIEQACQSAGSRGAKRAIPLKVGGAFHSSFMKEAKEALEEALGKTTILPPACIFIPNVISEEEGNPEKIRSLLALQLMSPVRWHQTMVKVSEHKMTLGLEIGPGKVLKGLAKKSCPAMTVLPCGTVSDIEHLEEILQKRGTSAIEEGTP